MLEEYQDMETIKNRIRNKEAYKKVLNGLYGAKNLSSDAPEGLLEANKRFLNGLYGSNNLHKEVY